MVIAEKSEVFFTRAENQLTPGAEILHSLNSGFIIHRIGQVNYDYIHDARSFALDLSGYINAQLSAEATTFVYEEIFGNHARLHWLVHMKTPSDYGKLLHMVDHDKSFQNIYEGDRLPERGGGNWEKIFVQGSFKENILIPQHGFATEAMDDLEADCFVPPARHQIKAENEPLLNSSNTGVIVRRTFQAKYESRDLARLYLSQWQTYINDNLPAAVSSGQYEEMWGSQDRLHLLIHLQSLEDYKILHQFEREDAGLKEIMSMPRVNLKGEELGWGGLFEPNSVKDIVLLPTEPKKDQS